MVDPRADLFYHCAVCRIFSVDTGSPFTCRGLGTISQRRERSDLFVGLNTSRESYMQVVKSLVKDTASLGLHNLHVDYVDEVRVASHHLLLHIYHTPPSRPHSVKNTENIQRSQTTPPVMWKDAVIHGWPL